ncbi:porin family protein [Sutterella megalosphaeroides]|uniref:Porin domain-containing protein n=1 Tax=Sutterella megalosphaeroides TaxID=2494234 RepID=A0A2Z6ICP1_9BURK|nr:hypothetical protein [Sutterella megalosphaeroides]BBF23397.1 hypothetical protein SUTMEG_12880 [Sutterella megalosphaeroides]
MPLAAGDLTVGVYYAEGDTSTLHSAWGRGWAETSYVGLSARYAYPLSKRTSLYAGAGYAEEKIDLKNDAGTNRNTNTVGQAYAGITHTF